MKNTLLKITLATLSVVVLVFSLSVSVVAAGNGIGKGNPGPMQITTLTTEEIQYLTLMREEEKLARDVYDVLYQKWGLRVFDNISDSEQKHMDAVLKMLNKYDIDDPALGPGNFSDESGLQGVYDDLIDKGNLSVIDALKVGVDIEMLDIEDLEEALDNTRDTLTDIETVYNNLMDGSHRHLDAFQTNLEKRGVIYPEP